MVSSSGYIDDTLRIFYEDLLKTKKQLEELKYTINKTLSEIKSLDQILKEKQNKIRQKKAFTHYQRDIQPLKSWFNMIECKKCDKKFYTGQQMFEHQKQHHQRCTYCKDHYFESKYNHQKHLCCQFKLLCQTCSVLVERKNIDRHVKICSFRRCQKCQDQIYIKSFVYHMKNCQPNKKRIEQKIAKMNKKQICDKENIQNNKKTKTKLSVLPCSLMV